MKYAIFGAGGIGRRLAQDITLKGKDEIVAFFDNDRQKQGMVIDGVPVYEPSCLRGRGNESIDRILVASFAEDITCQLHEMGVVGEMIEVIEEPAITVRQQWLTDLSALMAERGIGGNVAEAGVFRGDFAKHINLCFPDSTLYLFDTFEGFPEADIEKENLPSAAKPGNYGFTSVDVVLGKLPHPEKAIIKKGYFPESAVDVGGEFCFVNLDLDLYQPTLEGLKFFWNKMSGGGVILIHDFFGTDYPNVRTAVYDFEMWLGQRLKLLPIGDTLSIAIYK